MSEGDSAMRAALDAVVAAAHAKHDPTWVPVDRFEAAAIERSGGAEATAERVSRLHGADLYGATACGEGVWEAIAWFEREHMVHIGDFVARTDASSTFADEVRQRLRVRLLVRTEDAPPRIVSYSGSGPLGGWLRVCAVREARDVARRGGKDDLEIDDAVAGAEPEVIWLKERYGALVSMAFKNALDALSLDERTMLKMHYIDGLTLEEIASLFKYHRATGARALAKVRSSLLDGVRDELRRTVGLEAVSADSLLAFVRSRIELDLAAHLR